MNKLDENKDSEFINIDGVDVPPHKVEFMNDIKELIKRDDLKTRRDVVKEEFNKAVKLAGKKTEETVHRAYNIMGSLAEDFGYTPAMFWMGSFCENILSDFEQTLFWYKQGADALDGKCAKKYAECLLRYTEKTDMNEVFTYFQLAADNGVGEGAFACGEICRKNGDKEMALEYYQRAVNLGFDSAKIRIKELTK